MKPTNVLRQKWKQIDTPKEKQCWILVLEQFHEISSNDKIELIADGIWLDDHGYGIWKEVDIV